jgi:predicted ATPase
VVYDLATSCLDQHNCAIRLDPFVQGFRDAIWEFSVRRTPMCIGPARGMSALIYQMQTITAVVNTVTQFI